MPGPLTSGEGEKGFRCEPEGKEKSEALTPLHTPFLPINNPKCDFKGDREPGRGALGPGGWEQRALHTTPPTRGEFA